MSKPGKVLKGMCKKLGVRLTVKRGKKRVYKSVKVLKTQCANKKKKSKKRRRRRKFGMVAGAGFITAIDQQKKLEERKVQEELSSNLNKYLGEGSQTGIGRNILKDVVSIREIQQRKKNIKEVIEAAKDYPNMDSFPGIDLKGADLSDNIGYLTFDNINLERAKLQGANLKGNSFRGTGFYRAKLQGANLNAYLPYAHLVKANLQGANLQKADLEGAGLVEADLKNIKVDELTSFKHADLRGADLRGTDLRGADLYNAKLEGAIYNYLPVTINGKRYGRTRLPDDYIPFDEDMVLNNYNYPLDDPFAVKYKPDGHYHKTGFYTSFFGKKKVKRKSKVKKKVKKKVKRKRKK